MFDPNHPDMERALRGERRLTPHVRAGLKLLRAGTRCAGRDCRRAAQVVDSRGHHWCPVCVERRRQRLMEAR